MGGVIVELSLSIINGNILFKYELYMNDLKWSHAPGLSDQIKTSVDLGSKPFNVLVTSNNYTISCESGRRRNYVLLLS